MNIQLCSVFDVFFLYIFFRLTGLCCEINDVCWLQLNTTNMLLEMLACVDTVYLVACLFIQTAKTLVDATNWLPAVFVAYVPRLEPYIWPAASCAQTATVWTVLLLTVDRYAAVCHPFDARLRSLRRARGDIVGSHAPVFAGKENVTENDEQVGL